MEFTIKQMREALSRFCNGKYRMCVPAQKDDDDMILSYAIDQLEQAQAENVLLNKQMSELKELMHEQDKYISKYIMTIEQLKADKQKLVEELNSITDEHDSIKTNYPNELWNRYENERWEKHINESVSSARQVLSEVNKT